MKKTKLFVEFKKVNIEIRSEDGKIKCGIPYCFDIRHGEQNIKRLLEILGFDIEITKED